MSEWVSTKDKMPEEETPVLVMVKSYNIPFVGWRVWEYASHDDNFEDFLYWDDAYYDGQDWDCVTHWMPLPPCPEVDE